MKRRYRRCIVGRSTFSLEICARDRAGGVLCSARQGRRLAMADVPRGGLRPPLLLYFATSANRRPWRETLTVRDRRMPWRFSIGPVGCCAQRSKGGGAGRRPAPGWLMSPGTGLRPAPPPLLRCAQHPTVPIGEAPRRSTAANSRRLSPRAAGGRDHPLALERAGLRGLLLIEGSHSAEDPTVPRRFVKRWLRRVRVSGKASAGPRRRSARTPGSV